MKVAGQAGESIAIATVPNLRDLGGCPTRDGRRVRRKLLYRSTQLDQLAGADLAAFAALGIRSVYDLRTETERTARPDRLPALRPRRVAGGRKSADVRQRRDSERGLGRRGLPADRRGAANSRRRR